MYVLLPVHLVLVLALASLASALASVLATSAPGCGLQQVGRDIQEAPQLGLVRFTAVEVGALAVHAAHGHVVCQSKLLEAYSQTKRVEFVSTSCRIHVEFVSKVHRH